MARMSAIPLEQEIEYPTSDGQPMAETTLHRKVMNDLIEGLENRYVDVPDVWVGGNLFLCYERGNPAACRAPDVVLAKGVAKYDRLNYRLWEEKVPPSLIVEVTSRKTRNEDLRDKKPLYERLGVEEYVLFDPYGDYLRPRLQGYRLERGRYQSIPLEEDGSLLSGTTGVTFRPEGERLRMVDTATGERLLWPEEEAAARKAAEKRAAREARARRAAEEKAFEEAQARKAAEDQVRALQAELDRLRQGRNG
jgi:Uma2 family endonuclease